MSSGSLQLVAPLIADERSLDGSLSFGIDRLRIPIGPTTQDHKPELQVTGSATQHHLSVELKDDFTRRLAAMTAELRVIEFVTGDWGWFSPVPTAKFRWNRPARLVVTNPLIWKSPHLKNQRMGPATR